MARFPYPAWEDKHFAAAGKPTINVLKLLSYSSATIEHWADIGNAQFARFALVKKLRELAILLSAAKFGSNYEWTHHIPLSARYFTEEYWIRNKAGFEQKEKVLLTFLEAVIDTGEVDEDTWKKTTEAFSKREIVEIISMQGFYYTLARVTTVLKVDFDGTPKPRL